MFQVCGGSLLLVVQTLPLGIASGIRCAFLTVLGGWLAFRQAVIDGVVAFWEGLARGYGNARSLFKGLPGEAYLGFALLLLILLVSSGSQSPMVVALSLFREHLVYYSIRR